MVSPLNLLHRVMSRCEAIKAYKQPSLYRLGINQSRLWKRNYPAVYRYPSEVRMSKHTICVKDISVASISAAYGMRDRPSNRQCHVSRILQVMAMAWQAASRLKFNALEWYYRLYEAASVDIFALTPQRMRGGVAAWPYTQANKALIDLAGKVFNHSWNYQCLTAARKLHIHKQPDASYKSGVLIYSFRIIGAAW